MFLRILSCKHIFFFKVPACFHRSFIRLCLTRVSMLGPFDAAITRWLLSGGGGLKLCSTHECLFPHVELAWALGSQGGKGELIICWLCGLASLSAQICMLMSWGRSTMFGPAIGRANQGGRGGSKPRCCMFEQTPRGQDDGGGGDGRGEPALCRCCCFLQRNSTLTNGGWRFGINCIIVYMQLLVNISCISTAIFTICTFFFKSKR